MDRSLGAAGGRPTSSCSTRSGEPGAGGCAGSPFPAARPGSGRSTTLDDVLKPGDKAPAFAARRPGGQHGEARRISRGARCSCTSTRRPTRRVAPPRRAGCATSSARSATPPCSVSAPTRPTKQAKFDQKYGLGFPAAGRRGPRRGRGVRGVGGEVHVRPQVHGHRALGLPRSTRRASWPRSGTRSRRRTRQEPAGGARRLTCDWVRLHRSRRGKRTRRIWLADAADGSRASRPGLADWGHHQRAVVAAEAERVGQRRAGGPGPGLARHDVDEDLGVLLGQPGGRRDQPAVDGRAPARPPRASRPPPSEWPVTPLIDVTSGPGRAEHLDDGLGLGQVVGRGRGAVGVDVARSPRESGRRRRRASSMHVTAPAPCGAGAVMWWASAVLAAPAISA